MSAHHAAALAFLVIGCAALLFSVVSLLALPDAYSRLHALAPASTLGGPAIAVSVAIDEGIGRATVKFLVIAALMAAGGAVATMATGRLLAASARQGHDAASPGRTGGA